MELLAWQNAGQQDLPSPLLAANGPMPMPQVNKPQMPLNAPMAAPKTLIEKSIKTSGFNGSYGNQFDDAFYKSMDERKNALEKLRLKQAEMEGNAPTGLDAVNLRPLLAYADSLAGTNTAAYYEKPKAVDQHNDKLQRLQDAISKNENSLSDDQLAYLKSKAQEQSEMEKLKYMMAKQNAKGPQLLPGQEKLDQEFAKTYEDWNASGGYANVEKSLSELNDAANMLSGTPKLSGNASSILPDWARKRTDPQGFDVQQKIYSAISNTLKEIRGAQFTEKEADQVYSMAYDPALPASINIDRINKTVKNLRDKAVAKDSASKYFKSTGGTLLNYTPARAGQPMASNDLAPGTIQDGHQYVGGDPANPASWKVVK